MINWLKTLWKDLVYLSKPDFFQKYVLPGLALFFTWGIAGHLLLISLDIKSLVKNTGQVTNIAVKLDKGIRNNYYPLSISLATYSKEFCLSDTYEAEFSDIRKKLLIGDTVTLYTRNRWQALLSWGKQLDIYHINKDGRILFDISKVIEEKKLQAIAFTVFCFILWPWYIIYRRTRKTN